MLIYNTNLRQAKLAFKRGLSTIMSNLSRFWLNALIKLKLLVIQTDKVENIRSTKFYYLGEVPMSHRSTFTVSYIVNIIEPQEKITEQYFRFFKRCELRPHSKFARIEVRFELSSFELRGAYFGKYTVDQQHPMVWIHKTEALGVYSPEDPHCTASIKAKSVKCDFTKCRYRMDIVTHCESGVFDKETQKDIERKIVSALKNSGITDIQLQKSLLGENTVI